MTYPVLSCTAIDARDPRALADFYCTLLGLHCRPGDAAPPPPAPDDADWIVLLDAAERRVLAIQGKPALRSSTWPVLPPRRLKRPAGAPLSSSGRPAPAPR